jgi:hypothetical protein
LGGIDTLTREFLLWWRRAARLAAVIRGILRKACTRSAADVFTRRPHGSRELTVTSRRLRCSERLERCLPNRKADDKEPPVSLADLLALLVRRLLAGAGHFDGRASDYVRGLRRAGNRGYQLRARDGKWHLNGLRDPPPPIRIFSSVAVDPAHVVGNWEPYQPSIRLSCSSIQAKLNPADGDSGAGRGHHSATGTSPPIEKARGEHAAARFGAARRCRARRHPTGDRPLRDAIQARPVFFGYGDALPVPGQEPIIEGVAQELRELAAVSRKLGVTVRVTHRSRRCHGMTRQSSAWPGPRRSACCASECGPELPAGRGRWSRCPGRSRTVRSTDACPSPSAYSIDCENST